MTIELQNALSFFVTTFVELALLFVAISFFVGWIQQKLPAEKIRALLSGNRGYVAAVLLGVVTPFCSCSTLPMTLGLIRARAPFGPVMAFLITSPLLNPFIIGLFWVTFGATVTLVYSGSILITAILSGALLQLLDFSRYIKADLIQGCVSNSSLKPQPKIAEPVSKRFELITIAIKQWWSFLPYLIIGVAVGAVLHGFVPQSYIASIGGLNAWWMVPLSALIGILLYVRASTMLPIAASLVAKGMSMGAVISLTIAGAGASLPEMIMMKKMFHWPMMFAFIAIVLGTACITGFLVNELYVL